VRSPEHLNRAFRYCLEPWNLVLPWDLELGFWDFQEVACLLFKVQIAIRLSV